MSRSVLGFVATITDFLDILSDEASRFEFRSIENKVFIDFPSFLKLRRFLL